MAAEATSLVLNVKSDSVEKGADRLDHLTKAADKAERSQRELAATSTATNTSMGRTAATTGAATSSTAGLSTAQTAATRTAATLTTAQTTNATATARAATATTATTGATAGMATAQTGATATTRTLTGATATLGATIGSMLGPLLAVLTPLLALKKTFSSTVELQDYQAQLKTATGSVENAAVAFEALEGFASETPYQLEQSLEAFVKLTNLGLTPSEEALRSYGNTASAMGKDLTQLIEAVADATTGEFERLKEFGIKSKSEGDNVSFTFRGVTTTVKKNAEEIEGYLMALGQNEFAGAMADRMATVGGQVSNLGDQWNKLFRTISEMGVGDLIGDALQIAINGLEGLIGSLESGQVETALASWTAGFEGWADDFAPIIEYVSEVWDVAVDFWDDKIKAFFSEFIRQLKIFPARVRAWVQRIAVEIQSIQLYGEVVAKGLVTAFTEQFKVMLEAAKNFGKAIGQAINPFDDTGFLDSFKAGAQRQVEIYQESAQKIERAFSGIADIRDARLATITEIDDEFQSTVTRVDELTEKSKELRAAYEAEKVAKEEARATGEAPDALAGFKVKPTATGGAAAGRSEELQQVIEDLGAEEAAIEESYLKRLEIIRTNTEAGSELRAELETKAREAYNDDLEAFEEKTINQLDIAKNGLSLQLEELNAFYEQRREIILANEQLTEEEKTSMLTDLTEQRNQLISNLETARFSQGLAMASNYFSGYEGLAKSSNTKIAALGKAALVAQKAIAIAQATMKTYEMATSSYSALAGIPYVGPVLGAAAAAGAIAYGVAQVATIASTNTNVGSYATGGIVPGVSATGDQLTANVNSGEMILNAGQQDRLFNLANGQGGTGGGSGNVTIINQTSVPVEAESREDEQGNKEIIIREAVKRTKQELTNEAATGGGQFVPAMQSNFGLRRTGT